MAAKIQISKLFDITMLALYPNLQNNFIFAFLILDAAMRMFIRACLFESILESNILNVITTTRNKGI